MLKMTREYVNFRKFTGSNEHEHLHKKAEFDELDKEAAIWRMIIEMINFMKTKDSRKLIFKLDILNDDGIPVERVSYKIEEP